VLDCSIVFSWFFADEANDYADSVAARFDSAEAVVPGLWPLEVANALVIGERRGRSTSAQAAAFLSRLASLPIAIDDQTAGVAWAGTLSLARAHRLTAYDAAYLELAIREGLPLASLDHQLLSAAEELGVLRFSS
jgi:predicted nucleic acid-binding protein